MAIGYGYFLMTKHHRDAAVDKHYAPATA
jgi:hypothetical protein